MQNLPKYTQYETETITKKHFKLLHIMESQRTLRDECTGMKTTSDNIFFYLFVDLNSLCSIDTI